MHFYSYMFLILLLFSSKVHALNLEDALDVIHKETKLDQAEKNRQSAILYRMNMQLDKAFTMLENSLQKFIFNDWMLEDFASMAESLKKEKILHRYALNLEKSKDKAHQLAGLLLKSLSQLKHSPEKVIENLHRYSVQNKNQETSGLFLLVLQKAYSAIGNNERSQYFQKIRKLKFPDYYLLHKDEPVSKEEEIPVITTNQERLKEGAILQVGSFKTRSLRLKTFKDSLKDLGLDVYEEVQKDNVRIRIKTSRMEETIALLKKNNIDFYIVQGESYSPSVNSLYQSSLDKKLSTIQIGIFTQLYRAEKQKKTLQEDGFTDVQILWQEEKKLFYVLIQTDEPSPLLKKLKAKGYDAFVKDLKDLNI